MNLLLLKRHSREVEGVPVIECNWAQAILGVELPESPSFEEGKPESEAESNIRRLRDRIHSSQLHTLQ